MAGRDEAYEENKLASDERIELEFKSLALDKSESKINEPNLVLSANRKNLKKKISLLFD